MSEYQYYEFVAVDRPLTRAQMATLRGYSTRARITATRFVNEYHWGDFKGNPKKWMESYFDAHLYFANWGSRHLYLRLPLGLVDFDLVSACFFDGCFEAQETDEHLILAFFSENEPGDEGYYDVELDGDEEDDEGYADGDDSGPEGALAALLPLRAELARGDLRAFYVGWLLGVTQGHVDDDEREPFVPPGLGKPSGALAELMRFLDIDADLVAAAAEQSAPLGANDVLKDSDGRAARAWLGGLAADRKDAWLARVLSGEEQAVAAELRKAWLVALKAQRSAAAPGQTAQEGSPRRTAGELLRRAEERAAARQARAAEKAAQEKRQREREAAAARERHLDAQARRESTLWPAVREHVASKLPKRYDEAIRLLLDLRDLAQRRNDLATFTAMLNEFRTSQTRKPSLLARIDRAFPELGTG